jgi:hypothetical protein
LKLGQISSPNAPFGKIADTCSNISLAPGKTCGIDYSFTPTAAGSTGDHSNIPSNDSDENPLTVTLKGKGIVAAQPDMTVTPDSLAFGSVKVGESKTMQITIRNDGGGVLNISQITAPLGGLSFLSPFSIDSDHCSGKNLTPSKSCSVTYRFTPTSTDDATANSFVLSNDNDEGFVLLSLTGKGVK